jgi:hypothetical protein
VKYRTTQYQTLWNWEPWDCFNVNLLGLFWTEKGLEDPSQENRFPGKE